MKTYKGFFGGLVCFLLIFPLSTKDEAQAACSPPVKIGGLPTIQPPFRTPMITPVILWLCLNLHFCSRARSFRKI